MTATTAMAVVVIAVVVLVVVLLVTEPLRRNRPSAGESRRPEPEASIEVIDLEAAREAKYREIRDADLDHQTGKLSDADWRSIDSTLRTEAMEILRKLDRAGRRDRQN